MQPSERGFRDLGESDFVGYRIAEDLPAAKLTLEWQGSAPRKLRRTLPLLLLAAALGIGAFLLWQTWGAEFQQVLAQGGANWQPLVPAAFALIAGGIILYNLFKTALQFAHGQGYWKSLDWDAAQSEFRGRFSGTPLIGGRIVSLPFSDVRSITFSIGAEGGPTVPIKMQIDTKSGSSEVSILMKVDHVDRRVEAMDLLFRIARIAGMPNYLIHRNSLRRLDLAVIQAPDPRWMEDHDHDEGDEEIGDAEPDDDEEEEDDFDYGDPVVPLPVPTDRSFARYEMNDAQVGFNEPTVEIPKFDLASLSSAVNFTKVTCWEPGRMVRILRPALPRALCVGLPLAGGVAAGLVASWPGLSIVQGLLRPAEVPWWGVFLVTTAVAAIALAAYLWPRMFDREVVFDWQNRLVKWRHGSRAAERSLASVEGLSLGGVRSSRVRSFGERRDTTVHHESRAQLQMRLPEFDEVVIETDLWESDADKPFRELLPFTVALAQSLNVPWSVAPAAGSLPTIAWTGFGRGWTICLTLGTILVATYIGWHWFLRAEGNQADQAAQKAVALAGGQVTPLSSRSFRDLHELKNACRVEFPAGIDDARLIELIGPLSRIRRLDLSLSDSAITDASAGKLSQLKHLVALDLSGTRVSDSSVEELFHLNHVEVLNLSGTRVGEIGISTCALIGKLQVLLLNGTQANDNAMSNLRIRSGLIFVSVADTRVTREGATILQDALPGVLIEGAE